MNKNAGFSMVELLISVAVMAIIVVTTLTMMTSTSRQYEQQYETMQLQYQAQIVMTQLEEMSIDATGGLMWDAGSGSYRVVTRATEQRLVSGVAVDYDAKSAHHVNVDPSGGQTLYGKVSINEAENWTTLTDPTPDNLMSSYLKQFNVTFTQDPESGKATAVRFDARFERDERSYEITHEVALRNKPLVGTDLTTLLQELDAMDAARNASAGP